MPDLYGDIFKTIEKMDKIEIIGSTGKARICSDAGDIYHRKPDEDFPGKRYPAGSRAEIAVECNQLDLKGKNYDEKLEIYEKTLRYIMDKISNSKEDGGLDITPQYAGQEALTYYILKDDNRIDEVVIMPYTIYSGKPKEHAEEPTEPTKDPKEYLDPPVKLCE